MLTAPGSDQPTTPDPLPCRVTVATRHRRLNTAVALGLLLVFALPASPAHAGDGGTELQCESGPANQPCSHPGPVSTLGGAMQPCDATQVGSSDCGPDYGVPGLDGCWYKLTEPTASTAAAMALGSVDPGGVWYVRTCGHGHLRHSTLVQLNVPPADDPTTVARHARLTLHLPQPTATVHTGPDVVGFPTWLWLADGSWQPVTATATAGGQSITVTATPALAVWQTGDTLAELCTGPGTRWTKGTDPTQPSPDCGHLYAQRPAPAQARITVTVLWTVVASGSDSAALHLPALATSTTVDLDDAAAEPEAIR